MRDRRSFSSSADRAMAPGGGLDASSADPYYLGEAFDQMGGRAVMERIRNLTAEAPERVPMLRQVKGTLKHTKQSAAAATGFRFKAAIKIAAAATTIQMKLQKQLLCIGINNILN